MPPRKSNTISVRKFGPIESADIEFGDLTVLVGPQATGKSIFLQLFKLVFDKLAIHSELHKYNVNWKNDLSSFLTVYFGEGMSSIWNERRSKLWVNGQSKSLSGYAKRILREDFSEKVFYIPAQRVMSLREGSTRPFTEYRSGDPFALREFSQKLHFLVQSEFSLKESLFPQVNRLNSALRRPIAENIFGKFNLQTSEDQFEKRIVLRSGKGEPIPYLVWSAGQREFVPMLLGFYWLMPSAGKSRRDQFEWIIIEELEMGLHPDGITAVLALVMELILRGYRVVLSTHSPHVLDVVWALNFLKSNKGDIKDVLKLLRLASTPRTKELSRSVLKKKYNTYYFSRSGCVKNISALDPSSSDIEESGWGGLTEFSGHVGDVISEVVVRNESKGAGRRK